MSYAALLNTRHYMVRIKGKVEQSRERSRENMKIFTYMRVNELFGFSMVSSNYVLTNHTYNMYKQALALNTL